MSQATTASSLLLKEFPAPSYADWKAAAEALLKGAPFDKKMLTPTPEGITLQPIYRREDLEALPFADTLPGAGGYLRGTRAEGYRGAPWQIAQETLIADPEACNAALLHDLSSGQNAVNIRPDAATLLGKCPTQSEATALCGSGGLSLASAEDLCLALDGVLGNAVSFHFQSGTAGIALAAFFEVWLERQAREQDFDKAAITGSLNIDPLTHLASYGELPTPPEQLYAEAAALAGRYSAHRPGFTAMGVSTLPWHEAGASAVEEVAIAVATALAYLRELTKRGLSIDNAASQIRFTFAIGGNFFMELAKFRVARFTWARIVKELGGSADAQKIRLHARTGRYNKTVGDPYVNLLRTTTEALCGAIGGVDSLCVGTFDECIRPGDAFSRRIARNTQIILQEECELLAVADPAGGSWFIESLSHELGEKVWALFQTIEAEGGMQAALEKRTLHERVAKLRAAREKALARRQSSLIGTNKYPNLDETPLAAPAFDPAGFRLQRANAVAAAAAKGNAEVREAALKALKELSSPFRGSSRTLLDALCTAAAQGASLMQILAAVRNGVDAAATAASPRTEPLSTQRLAHRFEAMRAASAAYREKRGHGPRLFLVNWGALRRHKPRADFTREFFETGGFEVISPAGFTDAASALSALIASGAKVAVLCGSDDDYATDACALFTALRASAPGIKLVLAGFPGDNEAAYRQAGMDDYIFIKSDNLATNETYLTHLGVLAAATSAAHAAAARPVC